MTAKYKKNRSFLAVENTPISICFFGLPGAGKTSISRLVAREIGLRHKYDLILGGSLSHGMNENTKIWLKYFPLFKKNLRLYDVWMYYVMCAEPEFGSQASDLYKLFYSEINTSTAEKKDLPIILSSLVRDMIFMRKAKESESSYYDDDGVLQRLLSLFALRDFEDSSGAFSSTVISTIPVDASVVFVKANASDCVTRLKKRKSGIPSLLKKYDDIERRLDGAMQYALSLSQRLKSNGYRVIEIDSSHADVSSAARYVTDEIV